MTSLPKAPEAADTTIMHNSPTARRPPSAQRLGRPASNVRLTFGEQRTARQNLFGEPGGVGLERWDGSAQPVGGPVGRGEGALPDRADGVRAGW